MLLQCAYVLKLHDTCCCLLFVCLQVVSEVAEQEGGQAEIARVKSLQRILEKGCSYKGADFQFDLLKAKDNNRGKVWKLLL
jgi:hypothetical protein